MAQHLSRAKQRSPRGRRSEALRVIPGERVPILLKPVLIGEILVAYLRVRQRMSTADIRDVVSSIRALPATRPTNLEPGSLEARLVAGRLANAVGRTLRVLPTDSRCLIQSLVLTRLLSDRAIPSTIVIGAHSRPDFAAHAWVEHLGRPVQRPDAFNESRLFEI